MEGLVVFVCRGMGGWGGLCDSLLAFDYAGCRAHEVGSDKTLTSRESRYGLICV